MTPFAKLAPPPKSAAGSASAGQDRAGMGNWPGMGGARSDSAGQDRTVTNRFVQGWARQGRTVPDRAGPDGRQYRAASGGAGRGQPGPDGTTMARKNRKRPHRTGQGQEWSVPGRARQNRTFCVYVYQEYLLLLCCLSRLCVSEADWLVS